MTAINRPWTTTFDRAFARAAMDDASMDQVLKLCRNFVCSLNLGAPYVKHAIPEGLSGHRTSQREEYLAWVKQWKRTYRQLSALIRELRRHRKTVNFTGYSETILRMTNKSSNELYSICSSMLSKYEDRLSETAMMMLNARYNAKLAAAEARRREIANRDTETASLAA